MADEPVKIHGLKELQRDIRSARGPEGAKLLSRANKSVAEMVADKAQQRARSLGGVQKKSAPSITARGQQRYAIITLGGPKYPFAQGANFGAYHNKTRLRAPFGPRGSMYLGYNQFPEWGGNQHTGGAADLFMYWTIRRLNADIIDAYDAAFADLVRRLAQEGLN